MSSRPGRKPLVNSVKGLTTTTWPPRREIAGVYPFKPPFERHDPIRPTIVAKASKTGTAQFGPPPDQRNPLRRAECCPGVPRLDRILRPISPRRAAKGSVGFRLGPGWSLPLVQIGEAGVDQRGRIL